MVVVASRARSGSTGTSASEEARCSGGDVEFDDDDGFEMGARLLRTTVRRRRGRRRRRRRRDETRRHECVTDRRRLGRVRARRTITITRWRWWRDADAETKTNIKCGTNRFISRDGETSGCRGRCSGRTRGVRGGRVAIGLGCVRNRRRRWDACRRGDGRSDEARTRERRARHRAGIRDDARVRALARARGRRRVGNRCAAGKSERRRRRPSPSPSARRCRRPVSYTHLTLPTKA